MTVGQSETSERKAMERSWTTVDKADWGPGEWQDEPDKIQWVDEPTGLDCLIHRGPLGNLCGYVGVPPEHPAYGADYNSVRRADGDWIDVHGGLSYAARCADTEDESHGICHVPEPGRPHDVWWLGFDCGHAGDVHPEMDARLRASGMPSMPSFGHDTYKPVAYVKRDVTSLARQLAEAKV